MLKMQWHGILSLWRNYTSDPQHRKFHKTYVREGPGRLICCMCCVHASDKKHYPLTSKYVQYKHNLCRYSLLHMHAHTRAHTHTRTHAHTHARTHTHVCLYVDTRTLAVPPTHKFFAIFMYGLPDQAKGTLNVWTRTHSTTHTHMWSRPHPTQVHTHRQTHRGKHLLCCFTNLHHLHTLPTPSLLTWPMTSPTVYWLMVRSSCGGEEGQAQVG